MRTRKNLKRAFCVVMAAGLMINEVPAFIGSSKAAGTAVEGEKAVIAKKIVVDGDDVDIAANTFQGFGAVSCNNTSRLLMDYKEEHPEQYWEIMNLLFNPVTGAGLNHVKVELGGDVNSSSGTEPATMRSENEEANVLRGAGWHFAADALTINPNITVEALRWGEPQWTQEGIGYESYANPKFEARYQWYKKTLDAVYEEYGIQLSYLSPSQNERTKSQDDNFAWIQYCAERLNEDAVKEDASYDYSAIQIVAADTHSGSSTTATKMLESTDLMNLIDVVSDHYQLYGNAALTKVNQQYGKPVWYSEGIAPMINASYRINVDEERGGVGGTAGIADIATRFINSYSYALAGDNPARMTRFEFQPAVAAFYEGSAYSPKQLIGAFDPWSGYYEADGGIQMVQHFMLFADKGWNYLPNACYGDGSYSDGGVKVDTSTHNYMTVKNPETDDYTMYFANNTDQVRDYEVVVQNLDKAASALHIWETKGPDEGEVFDADWFQLTDTVQPVAQQDGSYTFTLRVQPYSVVTATTLLDRGISYTSGDNDSGVERTVLELPYRDDFEYEEYGLDEQGRTYLERRGNTPRYTTDQTGAFEVEEEKEENHVLTQVINEDNRPYDWNVWGSGDGESSQTTAIPITILGDHRWMNYTAGIDFKLDLSAGYGKNYAGIGVREVVHQTNSGDMAAYSLKVYADGSYTVAKLGSVKVSGTIENFDAASWHKMQLKAEENQITAYVDGVELGSYTDTSSPVMSGRMTVTSGFYNTQYDNLEVLPIESKAASATEKLDDTSAKINWTGNWKHVLNEGYAHYNRTRTNGVNVDENSIQTISFTEWTNDINQEDKIFYYRSDRQDGQWSTNSENAWANANTDGYYQLTFTGVGVSLYGTVNSGTADIYLDGEKVDSIRFNNAAAGPVYTVDGLEDTKHTIRLVCTSTSGFCSCSKIVVKKTEETTTNTEMALDFTGTGIDVFGSSAAAKLRITLDGDILEEEYQTAATGNRQTSYVLENLEYKQHTLKIAVLEGTYTVDGVNLIGEAAGVQFVDTTLLEKEILQAESIDLENSGYLEETCIRLMETVAAARTAAEQKSSQTEVDMARIAVKNAVLGLASGDTIVEVMEENQEITTAQNVLPELPKTVTVETLAGEKRQAEVTWNMTESDFSTLWDIVTVTGSIEDSSFTITAKVEVIPENLVYFIDSGIGANPSESYERIQKAAELKNDAADQIYNGSWGYVNDGISQKGLDLTNLNKTQTGLYAAKNKEIVYKLSLNAGTYEFTGAFREWWGMTRFMKMYLTYETEDGTQTADLGTAAISGSDKNQIVTETVMIPEDCEVEYHVAIHGGTEAPVISWLAVNKIVEETPGYVIMTGEKESSRGGSVSAEDAKLTASAKEGYQFAGWYRKSGDYERFVTEGKTTELAEGEVLIAKFIVEDSYMVRFESNGNLIDTKIVAEGECVTESLEIPVVPGYTFAGWKFDFTTSIRENTVIAAEFTKDVERCKLNLVNADSEQEEAEIGTVVTITADAPQEGMEFAYWLINGQKLYAKASYAFYIMEDTTAEAVYTEAEETEAAVSILSKEPVVNVTAKKISFTVERFVPEEYTVVAHGLLMSSEEDLGKSEEDFTIDAEDILHAKASGKTRVGTYTAAKGKVVSGVTWYSRGYVTYENPEGEIFTVYSDIVNAQME